MAKQSWWVVRRGNGDVQALEIAPADPNQEYALVMAESADRAIEISRQHMDTFLPAK